MTTITSRRVVHTDVAAAAAVFLDWSQDPRWRSQVRRMTVDVPGPARKGQQIVEELRFAGMTFVTPTRIEHAEQTSARWRGGSGAVTVSGTRTASADATGSVTLVASVDVALRGPLRPLTALLAPMYRQQQERDLDNLVALLTGVALA
ncbi:SRPBCC family protein [Pseudonocardia sp. GCM10023141]|uniref:SRPBCC family protein n=1 Tax=Pseudonocardia sp. GCM10023141 TaxID=3252653 RepID=UPI0036161E75